jgi:hypothetical protein
MAPPPPLPPLSQHLLILLLVLPDPQTIHPQQSRCISSHYHLASRLELAGSSDCGGGIPVKRRVTENVGGKGPRSRRFRESCGECGRRSKAACRRALNYLSSCPISEERKNPISFERQGKSLRQLESPIFTKRQRKACRGRVVQRWSTIINFLKDQNIQEIYSRRRENHP